MSISTSISLIGLLLATLLLGTTSELCQAAGRLMHVPLVRATTQGAGQLGQPILSYYSVVNIGTPAVPFKIHFDVGLSELFVPHYSWNPFNRNLHYGTGFQCKSSTTCQKTDTQYSFTYQNVQMTAKRYEDTMTLMMARANNTAEGVQLTSNWSTNSTTTMSALVPAVWRQNFLSVSSASDGKFSQLPIDGFFGLSPSPQSLAAVNNILVSLHTAQLIDNLQFSIWLNPVLDSPNGGELILGGVDTDRYQGQIYWHHLAGLAPSQWALGLQYVSLGKQVVSCSGQQCTAVLSTGLSDILGPAEDVKKIYSLLNTTKSSSGLELIDCRRISSLPYITFYIDGIPYYLLPSNYIRKTTDGRIFKKETCYVAILASADDSKTWTLATPFLGAYYSIYDMTYRQIGFAALK